MSERIRVFLIEDDEDIALLIRRHMENSNFSVVRCRTAADALIVLSQSTFDLVILDNKLPDLDGLALLQQITSEGFVVPVLMVTARGNEHLATRVLQAGALDYVVKDSELAFLEGLPTRAAECVRRHRLEQMNRLLIQALESAHDGVMITDLHGVILEVNQSLEKQSGYSRQELLGQNPRIFKSGVHPAEFYARMWHALLSRTGWQGEITNRRKDGSLMVVSLTISPIVDGQGRLTHFVGIQRDISEQKGLEQQLFQAQKMQSVGTLAGGVAHEFNNLLAGINGYASLGLREADLPGELRQFFQHIVDLSERAAGLTRQLLAFARKPALLREAMSPMALLRVTADLVSRTLHIPVWLDQGKAPVEALIEGDHNQLQQALVNLALNARDAILSRQAQEPAHSGAVTFGLELESLTTSKPAFPQPVPPGDYVVLSVRDDGIGMSAEVLQQALDPFYTTKEIGKGTGLGLPVVFGIVQGHQGTLVLESTPGRGTNAQLYLPRLAQHIPIRSAPTLIEDAPLMEAEQAPKRTIAVVDDEQAILDVVRRFVEIAGHEVRCYTSGEALLNALARGESIDLVVLDLMMPFEDAARTFASLREQQPTLPILLCTGRAEAAPAPQLLQNPATSLLRKPFRMNELWYSVACALGE